MAAAATTHGIQNYYSSKIDELEVRALPTTRGARRLLESRALTGALGRL